MICKARVKTNPDDKNEKRDTINSPTVLAEMFTKISLYLQILLKVQPHRSLKSVLSFFDKNDDSLFAIPTNMTHVLITVGNLKNYIFVGIVDVSAEVLKSLLPTKTFKKIESLNLFSSCGWFPECPRCK